MLNLIHYDRQNNHNAFDDDLPEFRNAQQDQTIAEHADHKRADDRAAYASFSAFVRATMLINSQTFFSK